MSIFHMNCLRRIFGIYLWDCVTNVGILISSHSRSYSKLDYQHCMVGRDKHPEDPAGPLVTMDVDKEYSLFQVEAYLSA